ncbi:tetratricopeptide repeat protein [Marinimicrobium alkaliphilum]|uniref:tetratricopeptide repeat protein n=1 Tax=Marinimicrobium alkaliphilum TaxID=2202654 RepID=UPI001E5B524F|nr:tetratricopeptide repeat protein [Marinimicrobium alkaliphilum]
MYRANGHLFIRLAAMALLLTGIGCTQTAPSGNAKQTDVKTGTLSDTQQHRYLSALNQAMHGHAQQATETLHRLSEEQPEHAGIWLNLTSLYLQQGAAEQARAMLIRAKALAPDSAMIKNLQGTLALTEDDPEKAQNYFREALARDAKLAEAHYNLALVYDTYYQDIASAITHYQAYLDLLPEDDERTRRWLQTLEQARP